MVKVPQVQGKIIDITISLSPSMQVFPGDPKPSIKKICAVEKEGFALSNLSLGSHTGTHVDAPSHILKDGLPVDKLELENLIGKAVLLDFTSFAGALTADDLEKAFQSTGTSENSENISVLLLKTGDFSGQKDIVDIVDASSQGGRPSFQNEEHAEEKSDSAYLEESAAEWIVRKGFKTIGVDSFSVDNFHSENLPVHHILISNDVNIVECLDLSSVETGIYFFLCLPLKIEGCDAAPARALLIAYP